MLHRVNTQTNGIQEGGWEPEEIPVGRPAKKWKAEKTEKAEVDITLLLLVVEGEKS